VLEKKDRDAGQFLGFGIFAVLYGITLYYILPLSLLSFNLSMIMQIFLFILFGIIFGLTILALKFQRTIETVFTYLFLFF
jgi:Zn-dependent protease with chaperone function